MKVLSVEDLWVSSTGLVGSSLWFDLGGEDLERAALNVLSEDCSFNGVLFLQQRATFISTKNRRKGPERDSLQI